MILADTYLQNNLEGSYSMNYFVNLLKIANDKVGINMEYIARMQRYDTPLIGFLLGIIDIYRKRSILLVFPSLFGHLVVLTYKLIP